MSFLRILGFTYSILLFLLLHRNFELKKSNEQQGQSNSIKKGDNKPLHLVFIGDSLTRYQYLTIAYIISFGPDSVVPRKLVNEKLHASWNDFFRYSTNIFRTHMFCDCFRTENLGKKVHRSVNELNKNGVGLSKTVGNKSIHKEYGVLNRIRENRYFHHSTKFGGNLINLNLTYLQFYGDKPSSHGRVLPWKTELFTIDSVMKRSKWAYGQLSDLLKYHVSVLNPRPTHIILSTGAHYHKRMMSNVKLSLEVALTITPYVYWKQAPPLKNHLLQARKGGDANFSLPWDIDILARDSCKMLQCYFASFPDTLPKHLIVDMVYMIPEYFDETHFSSPELYVYWSSHIFRSEHFELIGGIFSQGREL